MIRKPRLGLSLLLSAAAVPATVVAAEQPLTLDTLTVSATRARSLAGKTPQKITVITREEIRSQLAITTDQAQVLSNLIPSYSPSRQKLSNSGETFRGRSPLFLVDGVPQSNPLRDGARDGYTIDLSLVERIEVIHGASAEHGLGATGGIINFVTRRPEGATLKQSAGVSVTSPTDYEADGLGYKFDYQVSGSKDSWDFLAGATYQSRGMFYDADGRRIGVDNTQGDIMDSDSHDILLKVGYWLDDDQNLELMINRFYLAGDNDYINVPGDRDNGIPATSVRGTPEGDAPHNSVLTTSLSYRNDDFAGNEVGVQVYSQRFRARYGGGTFASFQDPNYAPEGELFDQSQNESDKLGAKFTVSRDGLLDNRLKLTGGLDLLRDQTRQTLVKTGREWVPETEFRNIAPFLQAELRPVEKLTVQAGVRYEYAKLDVDTYRTLWANTDPGGGVTVDGGSPSFDETLYNIGATLQTTSWLQLFANYSQGFGMPDVGRVLRGIDEPGEDIDTFLNLQPIVTDNREVGLRIARSPVDFEISYFESDADLGSRLDLVGGTYRVRREKTEIRGVEASAGWNINKAHRLESSYAHVEGKSDRDGDGNVDTKLSGADVSPDQLTLRWRARWSDKLNTLVQASHFFDRNFDQPGLDFEGYQLVDASIGYALPVGLLSVGVENLLNEDYITYYSQAADTRDDRYFAGRGRTVTLGYDVSF